MAYAVKEIFYTLQGEGYHAGRAAVFCRFAGCNLWSGRESDRSQAVCQFCDTDFVGTDGTHGGKYRQAIDLSEKIAAEWLGQDGKPFVVFTGGEPLLQLDEALIQAVHAKNFEIAVETNGTLPAPKGIDWLCVSPKANSELVIRSGDELKVIIPQMNQSLAWYETLNFKRFSVQACDDKHYKQNLQLAIDWCQMHPKWQLSLQTHKYLDIR